MNCTNFASQALHMFAISNKKVEIFYQSGRRILDRFFQDTTEDWRGFSQAPLPRELSQWLADGDIDVEFEQLAAVDSAFSGPLGSPHWPWLGLRGGGPTCCGSQAACATAWTPLDNAATRHR
jgi:hypothetical protein